jgi:hypothetical protein
LRYAASRNLPEGGTVKKRAIVVVLAVALLLVLVLAGTAYGASAPVPTTAGLVLGDQENLGAGSVLQTWDSWVVIEGTNGRPDKGSFTVTSLTIDPCGKITCNATGTAPVTEVKQLSPNTMEFLVPAWGFWYKVVDGGWPGIKKDTFYVSFDGTTWIPIPILAGNIIVH